MRLRSTVSITLAVIGIAYGAYPYLTLYRLGSAIRTADTRTLETLVDWPAVREGIKEDICDFVVVGDGTRPAADLPPFGASFMRGIASSAIDQAVTPQALLSAASTAPSKPASRQSGADVHVNWAFFGSPTAFMVSLQAPGQAEPIRLEMVFRAGGWRIDRVWLPAELLGNPAART